MGAMPCSAACFRSSACPRRKSRPPCTLGCRVFTRPPNISGQPVKSETSRTAIPVLSNTLMSARCTPMSSSTMRKAQQCKRAAWIGKVQSAGHAHCSKNLWKTSETDFSGDPPPRRIEHREGAGSLNSSRLHKSFQFDLACDHFHNVLDILAVLLLLQLFRFFQHKFVEAGARQPTRVFAGQLFGLQKRLV